MSFAEQFKQFSKTAKRKPTVAELYPELTEEQQKEAEYNLRRYIRLVRRIFERVNRENPKLLTEALKDARLREIAAQRKNSRSRQNRLD